MKRVFLKLSGEALAGEKHTGFDEPTVTEVAKQVKQIADKGIQIGIVIGGGNFWRGRTSETIDRPKADQIGMLATIMNCIYVSEIFRSVGMDTEIFTPFLCGSMTKLRQINVSMRERLFSLQVEQVILIFLPIRESYYAQLRWKQKVFILQRQLMVSMTAIRS